METDHNINKQISIEARVHIDHKESLWWCWWWRDFSWYQNLRIFLYSDGGFYQVYTWVGVFLTTSTEPPHASPICFKVSISQRLKRRFFILIHPYERPTGPLECFSSDHASIFHPIVSNFLQTFLLQIKETFSFVLQWGLSCLLRKGLDYRNRWAWIVHSCLL